MAHWLNRIYQSSDVSNKVFFTNLRPQKTAPKIELEAIVGSPTHSFLPFLWFYGCKFVINICNFQHKSLKQSENAVYLKIILIFTQNDHFVTAKSCNCIKEYQCYSF